MQEKLVRGQCQCGNIQYEVSAEKYPAEHCHCRTCQRLSGSAFMTWVSVSKKTFSLLSGKPSEFQSSASAVRQYCPQCGSQLFFSYFKQPNTIYVSAGTLLKPDVVEPYRHIFTSSKMPWVSLNDGLPEE